LGTHIRAREDDLIDDHFYTLHLSLVTSLTAK
jgi:hypothetical protein